MLVAVGLAIAFAAYAAAMPRPVPQATVAQLDRIERAIAADQVVLNGQLPSPEHLHHMFGVIDYTLEPNQFERAEHITYYRTHMATAGPRPTLCTGYELRAYDANGVEITKRAKMIDPYSIE